MKHKTKNFRYGDAQLDCAMLRQFLSYCPDTGVFTWLQRTAQQTRVGDVAGSRHHSGYTTISIARGRYAAHRLAWLYMTGDWPTGEIDHIDGDRTNTRWTNLRDVPKSLNQQNQRKPREDNKAGLLGVYWRKREQRWSAEISVNGKGKYLGVFASKEAAHEAYLSAKRQLHPGSTL